MAWGLFKEEPEEKFAQRMLSRDRWMNELWKAFRINLGGNDRYEPTWTGDRCLGTGKDPRWPHGALHNTKNFDRFRWEGESYDAEKTYCLDCGEKLSPGALASPWREATYTAWLNTRYMKQSQRNSWLERAAKSIKYGKRARRRVVMAVTTGDQESRLADLGWDVPEGTSRYGARTWFG